MDISQIQTNVSLWLRVLILADPVVLLGVARLVADLFTLLQT